MKIRSRRLLVASATAALALGGLTAAQAADSEHQIRTGDIETSTRSTNTDGSSFTFLREGVRVDYTDTANFVRAFFNTQKVPLSSVHKVAFDWIGTGYGTQSGGNDQTEGKTGLPAIRYNVDANGDGTWDCQLVGERAYGGQQVWLRKQNADSSLAANYCTEKAPDPSGTTTGAGGADGTLDQWAASLKEASGNGTEPTVVQAGFTVSDYITDGVLRSISLGDEVYSFTSDDAAPAPVNVNGGFKQTKNTNGRTFQFTATSGNADGKPLTYEVRVNNSRLFSADLNESGETAYYRVVTAKGQTTATVYKNGTLVATYSLG